MKKTTLFLLTIALAITRLQAQCTDYVTIPDPNFKANLIANTAINTNGDDEISCDEATTFTGSIDVTLREISDLTGIEAFINLTGLSCVFNALTNLNLSNNTALEYLDCAFNSLTSLDVSNNITLKYLSLNTNNLTNLDVSNNTALEYLECDNNSLNSLDVSNNTTLEYLSLNTNNLINLDLSNNTALENLECSGNALTNIDVSNNTALRTLSCGGNTLTNIDVSNNIALTTLICASINTLTNLDVSNNTALQFLFCPKNNLTSLDVSNNTALENLLCYDNVLTSLDVSNNTVLEGLYCSENNLTCIQVSDEAYANSNWSTYKDDSATFSTNCSATASIIDSEFNNSTTLYPNPVETKLSILLQAGESLKKVQVYNLLGEKILTSKEEEINIENLNTGVYTLKIESNTGKIATKKIIKK